MKNELKFEEKSVSAETVYVRAFSFIAIRSTDVSIRRSSKFDEWLFLQKFQQNNLKVCEQCAS